VYILCCLFFQPSAADFSLPGSAGPEKFDSFLAGKHGSVMVDGKHNFLSALSFCVRVFFLRLCL
jgi:hypothetical protein